MMMSSNAVGNNEFNAVGLTPLNAKKPQAKKETKGTLPSAQPDSFERAKPRTMTEEETATVETPAKQGGNNGLLGTVLGSLGLLVASGTAIFVGVKYGEMDKALKATTQLAESAQKEVVRLEKQLTEKASVEYVDESIALVENGSKAARDVLKNGINKALETKADKQIVTEINGSVAQLETNSPTKAFVVNEALESNEDIWGSPLPTTELAATQPFQTLPNENLETKILPEAPKPSAVVVQRTFPSEVQPLFQFPDKLEEPPAFLALKKKQQDGEDGVTSLDLINNIFSFIDDELPTDIAKLSYCASPGQVRDDEYQGQMSILARTASAVSEFYRGKITEEELTRSLNGFLSDADKEAIVPRAQAVVNGKTPAEVKAAQKDLVTLLKETFGKTKAEQFKARYPDEVSPFLEIVDNNFDPECSIRANLLKQRGYEEVPMTRSAFNSQIREITIANSNFLNEEQQKIVINALKALFAAKNGDNLLGIEAVQELDNPKEVVTVFQAAIKTLFSSSETPTDDIIKAETKKVIGVIKRGFYGIPSSNEDLV
jgi:hypothetical protein